MRKIKKRLRVLSKSMMVEPCLWNKCADFDRFWVSFTKNSKGSEILHKTRKHIFVGFKRYAQTFLRLEKMNELFSNK